MQLNAIMNTVTRNDVFVAGGQPSVTYVNRGHLGLERALDKAVDQNCIIVSLTGATKCGKTVLCHRVLRHREYVWIDGGQVRSEADVWQKICSELGQASEIQISEKIEIEGKLGGEVGLNAPLGSGPSIKITSGGSRLKVRENITTQRPDPMHTAIENLLKENITLVIDDFHYIDESNKSKILKSIKGSVFRGLKVILLSTPNRAFEAIKAEVEITGRFKHVEVPVWSKDDLATIANSGFKALNVQCPDKFTNEFVNESQSSPLLMQQFCYNLCYEADIISNKIFLQFISETINIQKIFMEVANDAGLPVYKSLSAGPQTRTDRIDRPLLSGGAVDIYQAILYAISATGPKEKLSYNEIRTSLGNILSDKIPQKLEVSNALKHLAEKDSKDNKTHRSIDWDPADMELTITDPFFRFYLRWAIYPKTKGERL